MNRMAKAKQRLELLEKCPRLQPRRPAPDQFIQDVLRSLGLDDLYAIGEMVDARDRGEVFRPLTERQAAAQERFEMAVERKSKLASDASLPDSSRVEGE